MSSPTNPDFPANLPPVGPLAESWGIEPTGSGNERLNDGHAEEKGEKTRGQKFSVSSDLIEQTRQQIQQLTQEIQQLAQREVSASEFNSGFLSRVTAALASQGGVIWLHRDEELVPEYQINLDTVLSDLTDDERGLHQALVHRVTTAGQPVIIPPCSRGSSETPDDNPTASLLILVPVTVGDRRVGSIEIFQRPGGGPTTQRGYLRFVTQMARHFASFTQREQYRQLQQREMRFEQMDRFIVEAHRELDLKATAYAIVNEGRKFTQVDRVGLAVIQRDRWEVMAVSGLDSVERRSSEIKGLTHLIERVCEAANPLWYQGDDAELPPQIEEPLHEYLDESHTKRIAVFPLRDESSAGENEKAQVVGCLIFEQIVQTVDNQVLSERVEAIRPHATRALSNAIQMHRLPLVPVLRKFEQAMQWFNAKNLPTTVLVLAAFAAVLLGMAIIPMSFQVACDGQLVPDVRRDVFAPTDGLVSQIHVDDQPGLVVKANSPLLNLSDEHLLDEMNQLEGRQRQLEQRIEALRKDTVENYARLTLLEEQKLQSQADEAKTELEAVRQSLKLKLKEFKLLEIQSPIEGRLVDWQITQKLYRRYVQRGQVLVSLVDPSGPWHVELSLPEKHLRHVQEQASKGHPVSVSLVLASLPGRSFNGEIEWVDRYATVDPVAGNSVQVRVKLDSENLPPEVRVAGARVSAKIACGSRSSGYVLFHDLWDTLQQRVLFWIW